MIENGEAFEEEKDVPVPLHQKEEIIKLNQYAKMQQALEKENFQQIVSLPLTFREKSSGKKVRRL